MAHGSTEPRTLDEQDARKTYRYLRIGIIGAVVALGVSIFYEWAQVGFRCYQTSISAYYFTPVRAVFVGSMIVVCFALIVYKGRARAEDVCLNFAGMFAPVVAVAPTTDVGQCWSRKPHPVPVFESGKLAPWLVANINNNIRTLLWTGLAGLILSFILVVLFNARDSNKTRSSEKLASGLEAAFKKDEKGTWLSLSLTGLLLVIGWVLIWFWDDFYTQAHGYAAMLFFIFLWGAIVSNVKGHWEGERAPKGMFWANLKKQDGSFKWYAAVALAMAVGFIVLLPAFGLAGDHTVFWLEAWEISWFLLYWILQTVENWDEEVDHNDSRAVADGSRQVRRATA
jgi:hypothetical protein